MKFLFRHFLSSQRLKSIQVSRKMEEKVWEFGESRLGGRVAGPRNNINHNNWLTNRG